MLPRHSTASMRLIVTNLNVLSCSPEDSLGAGVRSALAAGVASGLWSARVWSPEIDGSGPCLPLHDAVPNGAGIHHKPQGKVIKYSPTARDFPMHLVLQNTPGGNKSC
uniref:Uncharacterized protein n=1 Tax=Arundo donax TaxID=35708 RepID=A0A0A9H6B8_ARUDO